MYCMIFTNFTRLYDHCLNYTTDRHPTFLPIQNSSFYNRTRRSPECHTYSREVISHRSRIIYFLFLHNIRPSSAHNFRFISRNCKNCYFCSGIPRRSIKKDDTRNGCAHVRARYNFVFFPKKMKRSSSTYTIHKLYKSALAKCERAFDK